MRSSSPFGKADKDAKDVKLSKTIIGAKKCQEIWGTYDKIMQSIETVQKSTAKALENQRSEICAALDERLDMIKQQMKEDKTKTGET
jgi:hypothetical protein